MRGFFSQLLELAWGHLLIALSDNVTRLRVDQIIDQLAAFVLIGIERHLPAVFGLLKRDGRVEPNYGLP